LRIHDEFEKIEFINCVRSYVLRVS
jgi:hypothetical protein